MATLLLIDDEPNVLYSLERGLKGDSLRIVAAETARAGIEAVRRERPDAVLLDLRLPDMFGLDAFAHIHEIDPRLPVIIITAHGTTDTAIEAMKRGAFEYLLKPVDLGQLRELVGRAIELSRLMRTPAVFDEAEESPAPTDRIIGQSAAMQEVYKAIGRVSTAHVNVLLLGESGVGKELVARAIYQHSPRSGQPFLAVNCAAIPETLLESELFGHEKGSFTSADRRRIGKFEQASGGTIFLDEIGDMSPASQAKILRVLQDQRFERVGGNETIQTDVRIIAATNRELDELVASGRFRADLYHRLKVFAIRLPPLRSRLEDLPLLVDYFVKASAAEMGRNVRGASPDALAALAAYSWPGNVRELQGAVKFALVNASGDVLTPECFPAPISGTPQPVAPLAQAPNPVSPLPPPAPLEDEGLNVAAQMRDLLEHAQTDLYDKVLTAVDRVVLTEALRHTHGNQVEAARLLGISRTTLRAKMRLTGLAVEKHVLPDTAIPGTKVNA